MKNIAALILCVIALHCKANEKLNFYPATAAGFKYMGRTDVSDPLAPAMWATAASISFSFKGTMCKAIITDEELYGGHNYIDLIVDGKYRRIKLSVKRNELLLGEKLSDKVHTVIISKSTEAGIGYIKFEGAYCKELVKRNPPKNKRIDFYGDSITSGMGSDTSEVGCHKGQWYDQTNGYWSYASITGRNFSADYNITSASGIGMIYSCCNMDIVMPQVYDKISLRDNKIAWDFSRFQPDLVSICLGQNDGIQDSIAYCSAYVKFIKDLRSHYPNATFICLSSPMANAELLAQTKKYLPAIAAATGDKKVFVRYFSGQFTSGCDFHPSLSEHELIAKELTAFVKDIMKW
jgi:hypothetical protein